MLVWLTSVRFLGGALINMSVCGERDSSTNVANTLEKKVRTGKRQSKNGIVSCCAVGWLEWVEHSSVASLCGVSIGVV
jgi:hypothetical protein